jgi:hypothetical protein
MSNHSHDEGELHFEQIQHGGVGYEDRDLGGRGIIVFMVVLVVTTAILCLGVWGYFEYRIMPAYLNAPAKGEQKIADVPPKFVDPTERFPKPVLQADDVADMNKMRAQNNTQLYSYGYVDEKGGVVHVPIDQAIQQLAKQGLPTRQEQQSTGAVAQFGSGQDTVPGAGGGVRPLNNQ